MSYSTNNLLSKISYNIDFIYSSLNAAPQVDASLKKEIYIPLIEEAERELKKLENRSDVFDAELKIYFAKELLEQKTSAKTNFFIQNRRALDDITIVTAGKNQFSLPTKIKINEKYIDRHLGNAACGPIALQAVSLLFFNQLQNAQEIENILYEGISNYCGICRKNSEYIGNHLTADVILSDSNFEKIDETQGILVKDPQENMQIYKDLLANLVDLAKTHEKPIGGLLLIGSEYHAIVAEQTGAIRFFDSHGKYEATGSTGAFIAKMNNVDDAAKFLQLIHPYFDFGQKTDDIYQNRINMYELTSVKLKPLAEMRLTQFKAQKAQPLISDEHFSMTPNKSSNDNGATVITQSSSNSKPLSVDELFDLVPNPSSSSTPISNDSKLPTQHTPSSLQRSQIPTIDELFDLVPNLPDDLRNNNTSITSTSTATQLPTSQTPSMLSKIYNIIPNFFTISTSQSATSSINASAASHSEKTSSQSLNNTPMTSTSLTTKPPLLELELLLRASEAFGKNDFANGKIYYKQLPEVTRQKIQEKIKILTAHRQENITNTVRRDALNLIIQEME